MAKFAVIEYIYACGVPAGGRDIARKPCGTRLQLQSARTRARGAHRAAYIGAASGKERRAVGALSARGDSSVKFQAAACDIGTVGTLSGGKQAALRHFNVIADSRVEAAGVFAESRRRAA